MAEHTQDQNPKVTPETMDWDALYQDGEALWSGQVNGSLAEEVEGLSAGRALDIGCGEGADAIWLAERGWRVTAIDVAPTAVARGRAEAERRGLELDWRSTDVLAEPEAVGAFDLVSIQYPAFAAERRGAVVALLAGSVAPGGVAVLVGHAPPDDPDAISFDPADWASVEGIAADLGEGWTIECQETRPRPGIHHRDSPHTHDVVIRARRAVDPTG